MTTDSATGPPIYSSLIEEHGDVPGDVRQAAEALTQEAEQAVDFSPVHHRHPSTGRPESAEPPATGPAPASAPGPGPGHGPAPAPAPAPAEQARRTAPPAPKAPAGPSGPRAGQQPGRPAPERPQEYAAE
ncbi:hypothetical protein AB0939_20955 [Streptomyces sp. NPDC006990]|uniref:hypothetical protein n=1 Tax=Streptomyces sp. NPDC006990 TaxID=3154481 RepID=UPI003456B007